jgi:hypothetical protein
VAGDAARGAPEEHRDTCPDRRCWVSGPGKTAGASDGAGEAGRRRGAGEAGGARREAAEAARDDCGFFTITSPD